MNKAFLIIVINLLSCIFLDCKKGITDESNLVITSTNMDVGLPTQGLIAYYPFDGNADDLSGNNNGVNHGAILTADRFGHNNSAYFFQQISLIAIPELLSDTCSQFTFTAWINKNVTDNSIHYVIDKGPARGSAVLGIKFGYLFFYISVADMNGTEYSAEIADTLRTNVNYFLVGRYIKGQKVELLINGHIVASITPPNLKLFSSSIPNYSSSIGYLNSGPTQQYSWIGVIDDIRIYNRALSDQEVILLYHEGGWVGN